MANTSIYAAFERMWQHIVAKIETKADINHSHGDVYDAKGSAENSLESAKDYADTLIDAIVIPTKVSELTNDKGYLTSYTETDPTVPAWAKQPNKPTYTADEVGALPADTFIPSIGDLESYVDNKITYKQDAITGTAGQFVVIGSDGKPTTKAIPDAREGSF